MNAPEEEREREHERETETAIEKLNYSTNDNSLL
jgi:hypothetical protein